MIKNNYFIWIILTFISIILLALFIGTVAILFKYCVIYQRRRLHPNDEARNIKTNTDHSRSKSEASHQQSEGIQGEQNTGEFHSNVQSISKVRVQQREIEPISGIIVVHPTPKTVTISQASIPRIEVSKTSQVNNQLIKKDAGQKGLNGESLRESIASSSIIIGQEDGIEIINSNTSSNSATPCCLEEQMLNEANHENMELSKRKVGKIKLEINVKINYKGI
uniref:Uncharacterized protein n=1 Tax=Meloidogyne hapla TaxID=6305 RepID=A0A1I8B7X7_MELHA